MGSHWCLVPQCSGDFLLWHSVLICSCNSSELCSHTPSFISPMWTYAASLRLSYFQKHIVWSSYISSSWQSSWGPVASWLLTYHSRCHVFPAFCLDQGSLKPSEAIVFEDLPKEWLWCNSLSFQISFLCTAMNVVPDDQMNRTLSILIKRGWYLFGIWAASSVSVLPYTHIYLCC